MKDRIKQYMDYKSISAGELSSILEVQRSNISHILNGRNKPGASFLERLLISFTDLNARWLFTGEGDMTENALTPVKDNVVEPKEVDTEEEPKLEVKQAVPNDRIVNTESKPIDKIVILFADGTFTDFKRK